MKIMKGDKEVAAASRSERGSATARRFLIEGDLKPEGVGSPPPNIWVGGLSRMLYNLNVILK
jgi:hypothetical protein